MNQKAQLYVYTWWTETIATDSCIHNKWSISKETFMAMDYLIYFTFAIAKSD